MKLHITQSLVAGGDQKWVRLSLNAGRGAWVSRPCVAPLRCSVSKQARRLFSLVSILFLAIALSIGSLRAQNVVQDPGFEQGTGTSEGWNVGSGKNGAEGHIDSKEFHGGKSSLLLQQAKPLLLPEESKSAPNMLKFIGDKKAGGYVAAVQYVPVQAGKRYNFKLWFKAIGLLRENRDDPKQGYASFMVRINWMKDRTTPVSGKDNSVWVLNQQLDAPDDWIPVENSMANRALKQAYLAPADAQFAAISLILSTNAPDVTPKVWVDDVSLADADSAPTGNAGGATSSKQREVQLVNPGFEEADNAGPKGWKPVGTAKTGWVSDPVHSGKRAVSVSDAGLGNFSGWSTDVSVQKDRSYTFSGWIKAGALAPQSSVTGAALCLQFLDKDAQAIGSPTLSPTVTAGSDWTRVEVRAGPPPAGATSLRLIAGLQFCHGTAWFDDVKLTAGEQSEKMAFVQRPHPQPAEGVHFATNLLVNGDVEAGENGKPKGWSYIGSSEKNWTPEQIAEFHRLGRAKFAMGRGRGEWSHDMVYAGGGALLNVSIDPPLSKNAQWYGMHDVDGYWLSDPMRCEAGNSYLAGAWLRPGAMIHEVWYGPLEIQFFNEAGKKIARSTDFPSGIRNAQPGAWTYWMTLPYTAPEGAVTMRLRFGQEINAAVGGWGKTYADNLAVWELPEGAPIGDLKQYLFNTERFWKWARQAHAEVKPPYLASPVSAPEYESCMGRVENDVPGNVFYDLNTPIPLKVVVSSMIGETRKVSLHIDQFDWLGSAATSADVPDVELKGFSDGKASVMLPPTKSYGTFYLDGKIKEGDAVVGHFSGRYAVLPQLNRPHTAENIWAVTTLIPFTGGDTAYEKELGETLKVAGFGLGWLNTRFEDPEMSKTQREVEWYRSLGIRPILRINHFPITRPIDKAYFEELGKKVATIFKGKVAAYGNWGVEQSSPRTPDKPVFRPIIDGKMLSNEEYDTILSYIYDGIKSVDKETPVLIGNIAGDNLTIPRLYGKPADGRFDGAITNSYMGILKNTMTSLKQFDEHGDTQKTIWQEETADQSSPCAGASRRRGEAEGPKNMVRTWISMKAVAGPRLKAMTMWGYATGADIDMVTPELQPRPQFAAHAVMADTLADAVFVADRSQNNVTIFEWKRGDGPMFTVWANAGQRSVTFAAPEGKLTVMDLMGNRTEMKATNGVVSLQVTTSPLYVFGGGNLTVSKRLEARLEHGSTQFGKPTIRLVLKNNGKEALEGKAVFSGPIQGGASIEFKVVPGETTSLTVPVKSDLPTDKRTDFAAECTTTEGAVYFASAGLNFAEAVKTEIPPSMDGTWKGWEAVPATAFWTVASQIEAPSKIPGRTYGGQEDISGKFRLLWDSQFLYLGVEALDNSFFPQPERGMSGFMGDSIEFAVQSENLMSPLAPYWEYELYLPDGKPPYAASRRLPLPTAMITDWKASVITTGDRGNVNYQVAIPWKDLGVTAPATGRTISFALVLNDADAGDRLSGGRCRVRWFQGMDIARNPTGFGDVTLVER